MSKLPIVNNILILFAVACIFSSCDVSQTENSGDTEEDIPNNNNPIIVEKFTADPAAIVYDETVYLYAGHDEAGYNDDFYNLNEWLVYSSTDMVNWEEHDVPLRATDFEWASGDAWAAEVIEKAGKFYWYVTVTNAADNAKAIGVAVSDSPTGPFEDAIGSPLVTNDMTTETDITWDDIDPTTFIDDDGQAYMFWGNTVLYYSKLADNMIELEGEIKTIDLPFFTEAPWLHEKDGKYYLSYAYDFPEKTAYAMSSDIEGPYEYKGIISEESENSNTNHQAIIEFKGQDYFIYHNGILGGSYQRSVCIDSLFYNSDGTMQKVELTNKGVGEVR